MDIGEQKRVIMVEPEPLQAPVEEPIVPERESVPVPVPGRDGDKVPA